MSDSSGGDAHDDAMLHALSPSAEEAQLLQSAVNDPSLHDRLLFMLLRAQVGERVSVLVNERMCESDSFTGTSLPELVATGRYLQASISRRLEANGKCSFTLSCDTMTALNKTYEDDDVQDFLIEYFMKDLIRFADEVCRARSVLRGAEIRG